MDLEEIAPKKGQRALILGGSRSGKSVLMDMLIRYIVKVRPLVRGLLLDTKPRFRAELEKRGPIVRDASRHYRDWEKGPVVPGSYRIDIHSDSPLKGYWKPDDPCRIAIAQTEEESDRPLLLNIANQWYQARARGADRLFICDELLDFYHANGVCISPRANVPLKVNRAGGERGIGGLYGAQRPKGIPIQITEELTILYLFHLRFKKDMNYLYENGVPTHIEPPEEDYAFRVISINPGGKAEDRGLYRLKLEDWYINQLSDT